MTKPIIALLYDFDKTLSLCHSSFVRGISTFMQK